MTTPLSPPRSLLNDPAICDRLLDRSFTAPDVPNCVIDYLFYVASEIRSNGITGHLASTCISIVVQIIYSGLVSHREVALHVKELVDPLAEHTAVVRVLMDIVLSGPLLLPSLFAHSIALPRPLYSDGFLAVVPPVPKFPSLVETITDYKGRKTKNSK
ncbi:hypothetical protein P9112_001943 [Eukaryota sp. TZLM1-RC]